MKRRILGTAVALLSGLTLFACSGKKEEAKPAETTKAEGTEAQKADAEKTEASSDGLVYWSMWEATEPQGKVIKEAAEAFTAETGIPVDVQFKGRTGIREGLQPALDAGTNIDLFDEDIDRVNKTWGDYLLDLEELAKANDYEKTANAGLINACREVGGGTLKSIPYQPNVFAMFYNQEIFDKAGVTEVPKTWEELDAACAKIKAAGFTPITSDDAYILSNFGYHLSRINGYEKASEIVKEGKWDDPSVLEVAKAYEDITGEDFSWGCFSYPAVKGGKDGVEASNYGAQVFAINKKSKKAEDAFKLIQYFTKGKFDEKLSQESLGIPADSDNKDWPKQLSHVRPVMEELKTRYPWAASAEDNVDMTPILKENFMKLCGGSITAEEFVANLKK